MHVEFRNRTTAKCYYLCGPESDYHGLTWVPHIREHLTTLDKVMTVGQLCDLVRPVIDRLMEGSNDRWEMTVFYYKEKTLHSLTESPIAIIAKYEVGDVCIIDGVRQKTQFHPKY